MCRSRLPGNSDRQSRRSLRSSILKEEWRYILLRRNRTGSIERREGQEKYEPNPLQNGDEDQEKESPEFILLSSEEGL